jgi:hypothetical protein
MSLNSKIIKNNISKEEKKKTNIEQRMDEMHTRLYQEKLLSQGFIWLKRMVILKGY